MDYTDLNTIAEYYFVAFLIFCAVVLSFVFLKSLHDWVKNKQLRTAVREFFSYVGIVLVLSGASLLMFLFWPIIAGIVAYEQYKEWKTK